MDTDYAHEADTQDWRSLSKLLDDKPFVIERVALRDQPISIEGRFELPPLARLNAEDQVFVACFVQAGGSIKQMERLFGVSYPTIKARLQRIADRLPRIDIQTQPLRRTESAQSILHRLESGQIDARTAEALLLGESPPGIPPGISPKVSPETPPGEEAQDRRSPHPGSGT